MRANFQSFKHMLKTLHHTFSVICITETWLSDDDFHSNSDYNLPSYYAEHFERKNDKRGGGVCMYIHNTFSYIVKSFLSISNCDVECLTIHLQASLDKHILVSTIYRPPSGVLQNLSGFLNKLVDSRRLSDCFFLGDFNSNYLRYTTDKLVKDFYDHLFQLGMTPIITKPTRITLNSRATLDNIIVSTSTNNITGGGIILTDVSDHFPIFFTYKPNFKLATNNSQSTTYTKRNFSDANVEIFVHDLNTSDWSNIYRSTCANTAYEYFIRTFKFLYERSFPEKTVSPRSDFKNPWMTKALLKSSKRKQRLYVKFLKKRTSANEHSYKTYKNIFVRLVKEAKKKYYSQSIDKNATNPQNLWKTIRQIIGKDNCHKTSLPPLFNHEGQKYTQKSVISNAFNRHFVNLGPNLASSLPQPNQSFDSYIFQKDSVMSHEDLSVAEFEKAIKDVNFNKSPGYDGLKGKVIKKVLHLVKPQLFHIFDCSLKTGVFPDAMKIARVIPLHKKGGRDKFTNYRPISILPLFSKILERVIYNRVIKYFNDENLLFCSQYGFQAGRSTELALLEVTKIIQDNMSKKRFTLGVFLDFSKAFDTVDHSILLKKLRLYGLPDLLCKWFESYLKNRKQFVSADNCESSLLSVLCGVPQGSILGPLLFLIYINDFPNVCQALTAIIFADDSNFFYSHHCIEDLFAQVNSALRRISDWVLANKLSLNISKTKYCLFLNRHQKHKLPRDLPLLKIDNYQIERCKNLNFLGVVYDEMLTWKPHIDCIKNKISKNIGILYRARPFLHDSAIKQLYFSFIHSYLSYGNIVWASVSRSVLTDLFRKQKHAVRIVFNKNRFHHSSPLFLEGKILNLYKINELQTLCFVHKYLKSKVPQSFNNTFSQHIAHRYNTRNNRQLHQPKLRSFTEKLFLVYRGAQLWNSLCTEFPHLSEIENFCTFRFKLKMMLIYLDAT